MNRVLVTGATGFIGRRVCAILANDVYVRATARRRPGTGPWEDVVQWEAPDEVRDEIVSSIDTVIHAAGTAHRHEIALDDDSAYRAVNVEGTRRLCDACVRAGVRRFVFISSVAVLGEGEGGEVAEDATPAPTSAYARSKLEAERIVMRSAVGPVVLRLPLVYGVSLPGNLARMVEAVAHGRFPPVPETGNRRSMIHVDDAASAIVLAASHESAEGRIFTVTDGRGYSTHQIYRWTLESLSRPVPRVYPPRWAFRALARAGDAMGALVGRRAPFDSAAYRKLFGSAEFRSEAIRRDLGFEPRQDLQRAMPGIVASLGRAGDNP